MLLPLAFEFSVSAKSCQFCLTLCNPMDGSPPGSSVHGILQARVLEWVAILFSRGEFPPRDQTQVFLHCRQILCHLNLTAKRQATGPVR